MPSKLGIHLLGRGIDQSMLDAGMKVSKWVMNPPPSNLPSNFISVFRWVRSPDNVNDWYTTKTPEQGALDWIAEQESHFADIPKSTFIEGPNEPNCENGIEAAWLSRFEIARMKEMERRGWKCCVFNFGTGRPSIPVHDPLGVEIWTALLPALKYAKANGHIVSMHAYNYDPLDQWNNLRYRKVYAWLPLDAQPKLFIGEWGLDGAQGRFRDSSWRSQYANPDAEYMSIMRVYDAELRKDSYVLGFAVFTMGTNGSSAWDPFDIAGQPVVSMMTDYIRSQQDVVDVPPIDPPDDPPVEPPEEIDMISNPSFENGWTNLSVEQQQPNGWRLSSTPSGVVMGIPEKHSGGISPDARMVPAIAQAPAECVHKGNVPNQQGVKSWNLPENERNGQTRALVLDGDMCYKIFWGLANETKLETTVKGAPGQSVRIRVPILGESNLKPQPPNVKLEDDNWYATVTFGDSIDRRTYAEMVSLFEISGINRHWNIFLVQATLPASGELPLRIVLQDNWGGTDWFLDNIRAEVVTTPLPDPDDPNPVPVPGGQTVRWHLSEAQRLLG